LPRSARQSVRFTAGLLIEAAIRLVMAGASILMGIGLVGMALLRRLRRLRPRRPPSTSSQRDVATFDFDQQVARLIVAFDRAFPDRFDRMTTSDVGEYRSDISQWRALLSHYDAVLGYSTDGLYPLLAANVPFLAYEHGTIRNIPFEPTP